MQQKKEERLFSVDLLRVIAIILVVLFHVWMTIHFDNNLRKIGAIGNSLFFIISGYMLARIYPSLESFSIRWFAKRWLKIASFYYLALAAVLLLFGRQTYSGSTFTQVIYHVLFIHMANETTAYSIISPAWFLTPFIALYLIFPWLNKIIKQSPVTILIAMEAMVLFRMICGGLTSASPVFYLGEFCFGISFAYGKKILPLISSLLVAVIAPWMVLPSLIFFIGMYAQKLPLKSKLLSWVGNYTLAIFLMHEAFYETIFKHWHIGILTPLASIILLSMITVFLVIIAGKIQSSLLPLIEKLPPKK